MQSPVAPWPFYARCYITPYESTTDLASQQLQWNNTISVTDGVALSIFQEL